MCVTVVLSYALCDDSQRAISGADRDEAAWENCECRDLIVLPRNCPHDPFLLKRPDPNRFVLVTAHDEGLPLEPRRVHGESHDPRAGDTTHPDPVVADVLPAEEIPDPHGAIVRARGEEELLLKRPGSTGGDVKAIKKSVSASGLLRHETQ